jgi:UDP-glucose 4-epimerase
MILVTVGAGYIGSHCVQLLLRRGYDVVVVDSLSTGRQEAVLSEEFVRGDLCDVRVLQRVFSAYPITAVMHFAGLISVGESMSIPDLYYRNNVAATAYLPDAMRVHGVRELVFSSSAAVYGDPARVPILRGRAEEPDQRVWQNQVDSWTDDA